MVTVEHIRFASITQLAMILQVPISHASAMISGRHGISERVLERGVSKGISKNVLINGIDAKRLDVVACKKLQVELGLILVKAA